ncbi:hypothetical protein FLJC2902T_08460 [Flavobacterium limnosediminis JC2902]|uniref:Type 9 secretion system plug protein N-terminal domain-containing protein n=1 Tax=Flavobacterium limnosediminis JC2902 TaxID=1341181 RepID=V6SRV8_9FLAO|nr:DUF5103 domain-containing protein [Flavobacterium limnosediminis]ESU29443.1 hypothetical protein FLJC2902T_08460 [Flavobacterium limnosediminis JC2902]
MVAKKIYSLLLVCLSFFQAVAQIEKEVAPPFNIKSVAFVQNGNITIPIFRLGEPFQFEFDDVYGNEADYYYTITQYNYDWTPTDLGKAEYLQGMDNQRIINYKNSFNTLQLYSHYTQAFPNRFNQILLTGNYMLKIFNSQQELVFSRKFIIYEERVPVATLVKRSRDLETIDKMQNLYFTINTGNYLLQNPNQNVKVALFQNGKFNNAIYNIKPQYTIGADLIYRFDKETSFWGGNEYLNFENKDIRAVANNVGHVSAGEIYNSHLYMNTSRKNAGYTYYPDLNGSFLPNNLNAEDNTIEADYAWVYFTLNTNTFMDKNDVYISGMFNNYALTPEFKMDYNADKGLFEKALLIKQGFTNYEYVIADKNGKIDHQNAIDGNYWQTENNYFVLVYYRGNNDRYDRVIGKGMATSVNITN